MNLLPAGLTKAVYLTLGHSLWQGMALALLAAIILATTRRSSAAMRYNLLLGALGLFAATGCYTFLYELNQAHSTMVSVTVVEGGADTMSEIIRSNMTRISRLSFMQQVTAFLNQNAGIIVLLWLIVIGARMLQMALGLKGMQRLRQNAVYEVGGSWQRFVEETATGMGIGRAVQLATSALIKVPVAIGYFKPLILIPAGLLASLPPADLEAILAHELAHIRRRDYLANLLQNIVEIFYFFNPAIWWVSSLIRAEREHCCDDAAVAVTSDKKNYIRALVACQEYYLSAPTYALSFAGRRNQLLERARRLVYGQHGVARRSEKTMFTVCLVAILVFAAAFLTYARKPIQQAPQWQSGSRQQPQWSRATGQQWTDLRPVKPAALQSTLSAPAPVAAFAGIAVPQVMECVESSEVASAGDRAPVDTPHNNHRPPVVPAAPKPVAPVPSRPAAPAPPKPVAQQKQPPAPPARPVSAPVAPDDLAARAGELLRDGLVKDGLIDPNSKNIRYTLTNQSFEVNGVQQPAKIFRKYRDRYVALTDKKGKWKISYVSETNP